MYLDHAGTTIYSRTQIDNYHKDLLTNLYGNPHSQNSSSLQSSEVIEYVRTLILNHFGTDSTHYDVIFTSGCTAAMRLVSEMFPWTNSKSTPQVCMGKENNNFKDENQMSGQTSPTITETPLPTKESVDYSLSGSIFCYLEDNHTSVIGIREVAAERGAQLVCIKEESVRNGRELSGNRASRDPNNGLLQNGTEATNTTTTTPITHHLFAYPAQSNFNGRKYPLSWTKDIPNGVVKVSHLNDAHDKWLVLLDAAAFAATNPLNLTDYPAHFVALSFYKIFGFPTGLGALLVRQDIGKILKKTYFGGGTVLASISGTSFVKHRSGLHEK